jgi:hypothetical protein
LQKLNFMQCNRFRHRCGSSIPIFLVQTNHLLPCRFACFRFDINILTLHRFLAMSISDNIILFFLSIQVTTAVP